VMNLLTLSHLTESFSEKIVLALGTFASRVSQSGRVVPMLLAALSVYHAGTPQLVIVGDPAAQDTKSLLEVVRHRYRPSTIVVPLAPTDTKGVAELLPWTAGMKPVDGRATAYLCRNFACESPTADAGDLGRLLDGK
jgi:uncharacterized protein